MNKRKYLVIFTIIILLFVLFISINFKMEKEHYQTADIQLRYNMENTTKSIARRLYKENYYHKAEKLFKTGNYKAASEYYNEYIQSLKYGNSKNRNNKIAFNRKLASELLFLYSNDPHNQTTSTVNLQTTHSYYTIQVAAVKNKKGADKILGDLIKGGFSARIEKKEGSRYNFIRVGKFEKIYQAKKIRSRMVQYFPNGRNVKQSIIKKIDK